MSSPLRKQFSNYMTLRGFFPKTKEAYIGAVDGLAGYYNTSPDKLNNDRIQAYLLYLIKKRKLAWSSCNVVFSGLRSFYINVLKWDKTQFHIPSRPRQKTLPILLSVEEVELLLNAASNIKHRSFKKFKIIYASSWHSLKHWFGYSTFHVKTTNMNRFANRSGKQF